MKCGHHLLKISAKFPSRNQTLRLPRLNYMIKVALLNDAYTLIYTAPVNSFTAFLGPE